MFTGTKPKDNTQFDPNRPAYDFNKKVFVIWLFVEWCVLYFIISVLKLGFFLQQKRPKGQKSSPGSGGRSMSYLAGKSER